LDGRNFKRLNIDHFFSLFKGKRKIFTRIKD